ncbi:MAG: hypothetical protein GW917_00190, partial [Bdellovibrionales bacterium]|nr:hypothetical protein [Bdellovibrionales bacterium]
FKNIAYLFFYFGLSTGGFAQPVMGQNQYLSPEDKIFDIDRISVSAFFDNAQGIYSRPLERHLVDRLSKSHRFNFIPASSSLKPVSPEALLRDPQAAKTFGQSEKVNAFFSGRISQFPTGLQMSVYLFLTQDGTPLIQGELKNLKNDSIEYLQGQLDILLKQILERLPYSGRVLSRTDLSVTVNLGEKDGIRKGQELTAIQFISVTRHPKLKFLINTKKEIVGKIKILKTEPTLSFGAVTFEKEKEIIQKGTKIDTLETVEYSDIETGFEGIKPKSKDLSNQESIFGENPKAWKPMNRPAFGRVIGKAGLTRFQHNIDVSGVGGLSASTNFAPVIDLEGEVWITSEWTAHAQVKQGLIMVSNPRVGSSPSDLSQTMSSYELLLGYRFRFGPSGPSSFAEPFLGYYKHELFADSTQPQTFTTMKYSGFKMGVMGEFPVTKDEVWRAGGKVSYAVTSNLSESPVTSGGSSNNVIQFQFYGSKALSARLRVLGSLDFEQFSSSFSGRGTRTEAATSSSIRYMTFTGGAAYSF